MKKLVLGSLALAALASQTIGCTTSDPDDEFAVIRADWRLVDLSATAGVAPVETNCPIGAPTTALINQAIDDAGRPVGPQIVDLFDCDVGVADSAPLPPEVYQTFLEITTDDRLGLYATSLAEIIDVIDVDKTFNTIIANNGGYFDVEWRLQNSAGQALNCSEVAELDGIGVLSTITSGGTIAVDDQFDCAKGGDITGALPQGEYSIELTAFRDVPGGGTEAISAPATIDNVFIMTQNEVTILPAAPITITSPVQLN